ncbi:hypothetical protein [Ectopseudomonas alcaliphila]|uniref:hypothetical protein n=1 Tax=Ectopseudomonas alcaliphila TaxID=101564 RepID=UPI00277DB059|nr:MULTISPECIES: hypothetical protein [Pseudomonas]MDP9941336.1 hypothetical protein [Pseudomonas sp. 3400]MDR7013555.1 hypothetical protein [Pseudomonas alcaliphila]
MYEAFVIFSQTNNTSIEIYAQEIQSFYANSVGEKPVLEVSSQTIFVAFEGIQFSINRNCQPQVALESKELSRFAMSDREKIAKSTCRLEISGTKDSQMNYFNDFLFLIQCAEQLGTVWTFNVRQGEFM